MSIFVEWRGGEGAFVASTPSRFPCCVFHICNFDICHETQNRKKFSRDLCYHKICKPLWPVQQCCEIKMNFSPVRSISYFIYKAESELRSTFSIF